MEADRHVLLTDGCVFVYIECKLVCECRERESETLVVHVPSLVLGSGSVSADC